MATKTVVCPECGSPAAPGRYACSECGAMLASVAMASRGHVSAEPIETANDSDGGSADDAADPEPGDAPKVSGDSAASVASQADAATAPAPIPVSSLLEAVVSSATEADTASALDPTGPPELDGPADADAMPFDENAPLAAARPRVQPPMLRDLTDESPATPVAPRLDAPPAPSWPPPGDRGPIAGPEPRTPAGAYLPPSAVLPPLDAPGVGAFATGPGSTGRPTGADQSAGEESSDTSLAARVSASLTGALASVRVTATAGRRAVAVGAGVTGLGFVLPWVNTIPGSSPFANYLDRWGLVGAGTWVVLVVVVALALIAASSGRVAAWPIGLPAVATASFLGGLVWPWVASGSGRSIGVFVVLVGAVVLLVGGLLDRYARHERGDAIV